MQTLTVFFLKQEMPEIRETIAELEQNNVEILLEQPTPSAELVKVDLLLSDPSVLYTIGLMVGIKRIQALSDKHFKNFMP